MLVLKNFNTDYKLELLIMFLIIKIVCLDLPVGLCQTQYIDLKSLDILYWIINSSEIETINFNFSLQEEMIESEEEFGR